MAHLPHLGYKGDIELPVEKELVKAEACRIAQLVTHGVISIVLGALLLPAPESIEVFIYSDALPGWPIVWSVLFILGGLNVVIHVVWLKRSRRIWWSLVFMAVSYLLFGCLFLFNLGKWVALGMQPPAPIAYPIALYFGFFALLLLHIEASKPAKKE